MQIIKSEIIEQLKNNSKARYRLSYEFNASTNTINRWLEENHVNLSTPMGVNAIAEELEIDKSEVLIKVKSKAA